MRLVKFIIVCILAVACTKKQENSNPVVLVDDTGKKISLKAPPRRLVSLVPSITEMLAAICHDSMLVAVTNNCDYPEWVNQKTRINTYPLDVEAVMKAKPDLVVVVTEMCSYEDIKKLEGLNIPVYTQSYKDIDDIFRGIDDLGKITGREKEAKILSDSLRKQKKELENMSKTDLKVLNITWIDPIIVYGKNSIFTDKIKLAGADNAMQETLDKAYPTLSREYILKLNPDVIFGGTFEKMDSTFFTLYPELKKTNAYINKKCYQLNDNLNARPSPRVLESVYEMRKFIANE